MHYYDDCKVIWKWSEPSGSTSDEVAINKVGDIVILMPKENKWSAFLNSLELFSDDFMSDGREQPAVQEREAL